MATNKAACPTNALNLCTVHSFHQSTPKTWKKFGFDIIQRAFGPRHGIFIAKAVVETWICTLDLFAIRRKTKISLHFLAYTIAGLMHNAMQHIPSIEVERCIGNRRHHQQKYKSLEQIQNKRRCSLIDFRICHNPWGAGTIMNERNTHSRSKVNTGQGTCNFGLRYHSWSPVLSSLSSSVYQKRIFYSFETIMHLVDYN